MPGIEHSMSNAVTMKVAVTMGNDATMRPGGTGSLGHIDQYELIKELGGGGFGTVYLAKDTAATTEKREVMVAVKGLPPMIKGNREEMDNVKSNFALVSKLTHENIAKALVLHPAVNVHYSDRKVRESLRVDSGDTLMVMDYASGVTLSEWRKAQPDGIVPLDRAAEILKQIASALDYAHSQRIIHRDIKPSNVMVDPSDDGTLAVRVLDFGLAAEIKSSMSRVSLLVTDTSGTRPYMAPEQWQGRRQGPATDQYALAAMACELLIGEVPFKSAFDTGSNDIMRAAVVGETPDIGGGLPPAARKALLKALSKKPEDRFASCTDFVNALQGIRGKASKRLTTTVFLSLAVLAAAGAGYAIYAHAERIRENERKEAQRLKDAARDLKNRAEVAWKDAANRGFGEIQELSALFRDFERNWMSGNQAFEAGEFASATNFFVKVGSAMRGLAEAKRKIDEEREKREIEAALQARRDEVNRKVVLGYRREKGADGEDVAVWKSGAPHGTKAFLVTGAKPETWVATVPGYEWNGAGGADADVKWKFLVEDPNHRHWLSGKEKDSWFAEPGYSPKNGSTNLLAELEWTPGILYGKYESPFGLYKSGGREGTWLAKKRCSKCSGDGRVKTVNGCVRCNGSGHVSVLRTCTSCRGGGTTTIRSTCSSCDGSGSRNVVCSNCSGNGRLRCGNCGGSGMVANIGGAIANAIFNRKGYAPPPPSQVPCSNCRGGGIVVCSACGGGGRRNVDCSSCNGAGRISSSISCSGCGGSGKVPGRDSCSSCGGGGNVSTTQTCADCDGNGYVWQSVPRPSDAFEMTKHRVVSAKAPAPQEASAQATVAPAARETRVTESASAANGTGGTEDASKKEKRFQKGLAMLGIDIEATFRNGPAIHLSPGDDIAVALKGCKPGTTVILADGAYSLKNGNYLFIENSVFVKGASRDGVRLVDFQLKMDGGLLVVEDATIVRGGNDYGINVDNGGSCVVKNCTVVDCGIRASDSGGGSRALIHNVVVQIDSPSQWGVCASDGCRVYVSDSAIRNARHSVIGFEKSRVVVRNSTLLSRSDDVVYMRYDKSAFYIANSVLEGGKGLSVGNNACGSIKNTVFKNCSSYGIDNDGQIETYRNSFEGTSGGIKGNGSVAVAQNEFGLNPNLLK